MNPKLNMSMNLASLKTLAQQSPKHFNKAMKIGAIQFLNWSANGSKNTSKKPPIRWGVLRASGSAFVGNELVSITNSPVTKGRGTPNSSHSAPSTKITWGYNTDYATKMHEHKGDWGKFTLQDGDAGNKWLEEHIKKDADDLIAVIGKEFKKAAGL